MSNMSLALTTSRRGSALLIGLIMTLLISILVISFTEKVLRFAQGSQGIEQSTQAYYAATSTIESGLMNTEKLRRQPWTIQGSRAWNTHRGSELVVNTGGVTLPTMWQGNSPYSNDYNLISTTHPVQIVIGNDIDWSNVKFTFRVPTISDKTGTGTDPQYTNSGVILWTIGNSGSTLYASGETNIFLYSDINGETSLSQKEGYYFDADGQKQGATVRNFMSNLNTINCTWYSCTLKLSMLRSVKLTDGRSLPFLEYKIEFNSPIPSQFMTLDAKGYYGGYLRERRIRIPQITANSALDFAVLQ